MMAEEINFLFAEYFSNFHFYFFSICFVVSSTILFSNFIKAFRGKGEREKKSVTEHEKLMKFSPIIRRRVKISTAT